MKIKVMEELVQIMFERMPNNSNKSLLSAFCDGIATTYHYFHYEGNKAIGHNSTGLPSKEIMDHIQGVYEHSEDSWTAFILTVHREGAYEVSFHDDLNPTLECGQALLWLEYVRYNIEPDTDFSRSQLQRAIKAESFKKTLNYACMKQDVNAILEKLMNVKQSVLDKKSNPGGTPLHIVCKNGNAEIAKLLVEAGAKLELKYHGYTPLATACAHGHADIVRYLISQGEDVNGLMPGKVTPYHLICSAGNKEIVEYVLSLCANINALTSRKYSALHYAAESGNIEAAKVLIANDIDMELLEDYKRSALHYACYHNKVDFVGVLLDNGADVNSLREDRITPLHTACQKGFAGMVKIILNYHPDLTARATFHAYGDPKKWSETPIETAVRCGHDEIVDILKN